MNDEVWDKMPFNQNKMAMIYILNLDKAVCGKHIDVECGVSISRRDKSEMGRHSAAQTRQSQCMASFILLIQKH